MKGDKITTATLKLTTTSTENNVDNEKPGPKLFMQNTYIHTERKDKLGTKTKTTTSTTKKNNQNGTKVMHKDGLGKTHTPPRT